MELSDLLDRIPALLAMRHEEADAVEERILDGALEQVGALGFQHTTMDGIARAAGVGRMTVYRRFRTKQDVLNRLAARELHRHVARVTQAAMRADTPQEQLVEGFVATVTIIVSHPFLHRLRTAERNLVFDMASAREPDLFVMSRDLTATVLRRWRDEHLLDLGVTPEALAELLVRLTLSYVVAPGDVARRDETSLRALARKVLLPVAFSTH